jgi:predicted small secreted protein
MIKVSFAAAILLAVMLSSCANTAKGMATDAKQTGQAMDSSAHRVLKAGAAGNKAAQ